MKIWLFIKSIFNILVGRPNVPKPLENNSLLSIILNRRSVRSFIAKDIPDDVMAAILEAGRLAPSTVNLQTWTFALFDDKQWYELFGNHIPFKGSRAIMIMGDTHRARKVLDAFPDSPLIEYSIAVMNASFAAMNMNIAAEALGVSSVMLSETGRSGLLDIGYLKDRLSLPDGVFPLMTIVFGYARSANPPMPPKLSIKDITMVDCYRETQDAVMQDWLNQMIAGYKASHLNSSFDSQLKIYSSKIEKAESDLSNMVFHETEGETII